MNPFLVLICMSPLVRPAHADFRTPHHGRVGSETEYVDSSRTRLLTWIYEDIGALSGSVASPKVGLYAAGMLAGTLGLAWLDDDARNEMRDLYAGTFRDALSKHWATDLAVGALIGISMGRWLVRRHSRSRSTDDPIDVSILDKGRLFSVRLQFR